MKILLIAAQDIKKITLAWVEDGVLQFQKGVSVEPDKYLRTLQDFLEESGHDLEELQGIAVVTGPGSFTASRISVTMANALAWALEIKIAGLANESHLNVQDLLAKNNLSQLDYQQPPVVPTYDREPNITQPHS